MKKILDVPKIKQLPEYCAPASVAMVLGYYGIQVTQEEVALNLAPFRKGFCVESILPYVRSQGMIAHPRLNFTIKGLISLIERDRLALVRTGCILGLDMAHMSVIKGYDLESNILFWNDPAHLERSSISFERFNQIWAIPENNLLGGSHNYVISVRPRNR